MFRRPVFGGSQSDFGRLWRPKWPRKSIFEPLFFRRFFRMRFWIDFCLIVGRSKPQKYQFRLDGSMIFANSAFSKKIEKKLDLGFILGGPNDEKSRKIVFENMFFWNIEIYVFFVGFEFHFGVQKSLKNP